MNNDNSVVALALLDERGRLAAELLASAGARVVRFDSPDTLGQVRAARAVMLPMPLTRDRIHLSAGGTDSAVRLDELLMCISPGALVMGGMIPSDFVDVVRGSGAECFDYNTDEDFLQSNAYATAEGAIFEVARALDICLADADCAIVGYGRIARHLHRLLSALGVRRVSVYARRAEARDEAAQAGATVGAIDGEVSFIGAHDALFTTVPERVIPTDALRRFGRQCVIAELASSPGGFDRARAEACGLRVLHLPSLPSRYAPRSAAEYMCRSALRAAREHGITII